MCDVIAYVSSSYVILFSMLLWHILNLVNFIELEIISLFFWYCIKEEDVITFISNKSTAIVAITFFITQLS